MEWLAEMNWVGIAHTLCGIVFVLAIIGAIAGILYILGDDKTYDLCKPPEMKVNLEKSIKNASSLIKDLEKKKSEVLTARKNYTTMNIDCEKKIQQEKQRTGISSYAEAEKNQLISNNLSLISLNQAFMSKLNKLNRNIESGINELEFEKSRAQSNLEIFNVFATKDTENLISKINKAIEQNNQHRGKLAVNIDDVQRVSSREIWDQIIKRK